MSKMSKVFIVLKYNRLANNAAEECRVDRVYSSKSLAERRKKCVEKYLKLNSPDSTVHIIEKTLKGDHLILV